MASRGYLLVDTRSGWNSRGKKTSPGGGRYIQVPATLYGSIRRCSTTLKPTPPHWESNLSLQRRNGVTEA